MPEPGEEPHDSYDGLLALAIRVAREAADLVRTRRRAGVEVADTKTSPTDVVTEVDRASEVLVRERLLEARPDDGFLGEEGGAAQSVSGVTWIVDPIDGTVNFLYGIPQYAVSIAASVEGRPVAGVVFDVESKEAFTATLGGGAWLGERRLTVRGTPPLAERLVATGFSYERDIRRLQARAIARLLPQVRDIRRMASSALDLCYVGAGRFDAYVEEGLNPWDHAAGGLVATEAGARLQISTGVGGLPLVLCAPAGGFADFAELVQECGFAREEQRE